MRFTRWCFTILAFCWILLSLPVAFGGPDGDEIPAFNDAGGEYILNPVVGFFLMASAIVAASLLLASWRSRRIGDRARERNQVRWGIALTSVSIIGYLLFSLLQSGSAESADCYWNYYSDEGSGIWDCQDVKTHLSGTSEVVLAAALISSAFVLIVLLAARIGQRAFERPPVAPVPPQPVPPVPSESDFVGQLSQLNRMRDQGRLSEAEFEAAKARLLQRPPEGDAG